MTYRFDPLLANSVDIIPPRECKHWVGLYRVNLQETWLRISTAMLRALWVERQLRLQHWAKFQHDPLPSSETGPVAPHGIYKTWLKLQTSSWKQRWCAERPLSMAGKPFFTRLVPSATVRGAAAMVGSWGHCWLELLSQRGACQAATVANSSLKFYPHHRFDAMEMYGNVPLMIFPDVNWDFTLPCLTTGRYFNRIPLYPRSRPFSQKLWLAIIQHSLVSTSTKPLGTKLGHGTRLCNIISWINFGKPPGSSRVPRHSRAQALHRFKDVLPFGLRGLQLGEVFVHTLLARTTRPATRPENELWNVMNMWKANAEFVVPFRESWDPLQGNHHFLRKDTKAAHKPWISQWCIVFVPKKSQTNFKWFKMCAQIL